MQVEGQHCSLLQMATGARVSNAYATCLLQRDSPEKFGLIPHSILKLHGIRIKDLSVKDGHAWH